MIGGPQAVIALVIILLLFGGSQLPKLAKGLGRAQKEFEDAKKPRDQQSPEDPPPPPA
jgi:sec-independent protein translocase protein TatA